MSELTNLTLNKMELSWPITKPAVAEVGEAGKEHTPSQAVKRAKWLINTAVTIITAYTAILPYSGTFKIRLLHKDYNLCC